MMDLDKTVQDVVQHLEQVRDDPLQPLDSRLLDHVDRHTSELLTIPQRHALLNALSSLLPALQQDSTPIAELITRLVEPASCSFSDILHIEPQPDFALGLASPSVPINLATLSLLCKAVGHLEETNNIAASRETIEALVTLWLTSPDTGAGRRAGRLLVDLLSQNESRDALDHIDPPLHPNLMWRRVFRDEDIYAQLFATCSMRHGQASLSSNQKSIAQGRLLDFILALRAKPLVTSQMPQVEQQYGMHNAGLLEFATTKMVDQDDDLMLSTLISFCANYISLDVTDRRAELELKFMKQVGLHEKCLSYYLQPRPSCASWVLAESARYLASYATLYPSDLQDDRTLARKLPDLLFERLGQVSFAAWKAGRIPENDLLVIASLPPAMLFYEPRKTLLTRVHFNPNDARISNLLTQIFRSTEHAPEQSQAAARLLYLLYVDEWPDFWTVLVKTAETVAVLDAALAAHGLIQAIIDSNWHALPASEATDGDTTASPPFPLPSEIWLQQHLRAPSLPQSGIEAMLAEQMAPRIVPYLLRPANAFNNGIGSGRGDVESAAWQVAVAKHDVLAVFHRRLLRLGGAPELQALTTAVGERLAQGPMGGTALQPGTQLSTMEL